MNPGTICLIIGIISVPIFLYLGIDNHWGEFYGNFYLLGLIGSALFIIGGLALNVFYKKNKETEANQKKCPFCANKIKNEAIICQFCGKDVKNISFPDDWVCNKCGKNNRKTASFCTNCGDKK